MDPYHEAKILEIKQYIDENFCESLKCRKISELFEINYQLFTERFRYLTGKSPKEYILFKRFVKLIELLQIESCSVCACYYTYKLGFRSNAAFYNFVKSKTGLTFNELKIDVKNMYEFGAWEIVGLYENNFKNDNKI